MIIRNRSDPIICIENTLHRKDMVNVDKIILIMILVEKYDEFEFSIKECSRSTNISISGVKRSLVHLDKLGVLARKDKGGGRYKYILECSNI